MLHRVGLDRESAGVRSGSSWCAAGVIVPMLFPEVIENLGRPFVFASGLFIVSKRFVLQGSAVELRLRFN